MTIADKELQQGKALLKTKLTWKQEKKNPNLQGLSMETELWREKTRIWRVWSSPWQFQYFPGLWETLPPLQRLWLNTSDFNEWDCVSLGRNKVSYQPILKNEGEVRFEWYISQIKSPELLLQAHSFDKGHSQKLLMGKRGLFDGDLPFLTADAGIINWSEG